VGLVQYGNNGYYSFGGYVPGDGNLSQSAGLIITFNDTASAARINALAHDTMFFDGSYPSPEIHHSLNNFTTQYVSSTTADHHYYVFISDVTFLYTDTIVGYDIYAVRGTYKAKMQDLNTSNYAGDATNGQFYFQSSVQHFNH
jgi:hypothetical protein